MNLLPVKIPSVVKKIFSHYIWDIPTTEKILYLTFDDGPTPMITDWTLDVLKQYNAKATFFCIGNNIEKYPEIFRRIIEQGHAIGNHTFNHPSGWKANAQDYISEVQKTQDSIDSRIQNTIPMYRDKVQQSTINTHQTARVQKSKIVNCNSQLKNLFRPPYGQITINQGRLLRKLGYKIIMWDIVAFDWKDSLSKEKCYQNVVSKTTSGSIIVFHDSVKASVNMQYALPKVIDYFSKKGFEFRRIPE